MEPVLGGATPGDTGGILSGCCANALAAQQRTTSENLLHCIGFALLRWQPRFPESNALQSTAAWLSLSRARSSRSAQCSYCRAERSQIGVRRSTPAGLRLRFGAVLTAA